MRIIKNILPFIFCFSVVIAFGQTESYINEELPPAIENEAEWQVIVEGIELKEYLEDLEQKEGKEGKKEKTAEKSFEFGEPNPIVVAFIKFLLIATGVGIIAFLLYKLVGTINTPKNRKIKKGRLSEISLEEIEENIVEADLVDFIQQAVEEGNYNLAIRLHYLLIIKELNANNLIKWKKDKTNRSYLSELSDSPLYDNFKSVTQIFERVWYGRDELNKINFQKIQPRFEQLVTSIQTNNTVV